MSKFEHEKNVMKPINIMKGDLSLEWSGGVGGAVMCCFKRGMKKQF